MHCGGCWLLKEKRASQFWRIMNPVFKLKRETGTLLYILINTEMRHERWDVLWRMLSVEKRKKIISVLQNRESSVWLPERLRLEPLFTSINTEISQGNWETHREKCWVPPHKHPPTKRASQFKTTPINLSWNASEAWDCSSFLHLQTRKWEVVLCFSNTLRSHWLRTFSSDGFDCS